MMGRTFCPLGDAAAMPIIAFVKKFRPEFEEYVAGHRTEKNFITTDELVGAAH